MKDHDQRIIHSSEESDWRTPRQLFDALNLEFSFAWDFAADAQSTLCTADSSGLSAHYFGPGSPHGENALIMNWAALDYPYGFLNPPFSRKKARKLKAAGDPTWTHYLVDTWAEKCWRESQRGCTIVAVLPFAPQTEWYRQYVMGHNLVQLVGGEFEDNGWSGHAALQERRLPHRISFLRPDGSPAENAGVNSAIIVWGPARGIVGPWQPHSFYWSYRT